MPTSLDRFEKIFPTLVEDLRKQCCEQYHLPVEAWKWFEKSINHNAVGGKYNRALSVIDTTELLLGRELTAGEYFDAATLGWVIELLQGMILVLDDIMDSSTVRRNRPCWYLMPGVGMAAVNDAPMLEGAVYILLKKHFKGHPAYVDMIELFHEVSFQIELGQSYDMISTPQNGVDLDSFNLDKWTFIANFKTSYYTFYLPVALALHYTDKASSHNLKQAKDILIPMGEYFQVQDDYLDNFMDPSIRGKTGTDIQDNKCTWLVNQALQRCTPAQRKVLEDNYGRKDDQCQEKVKGLYDELALEQLYQEYQETKVADLKQKIDMVDETQGLKKGIFEEFLKKIYNRSK